MEKEEPIVIKDWIREKTLGSGGFGIVALWKNTKTNESIGRLHLEPLPRNSENTDIFIILVKFGIYPAPHLSLVGRKSLTYQTSSRRMTFYSTLLNKR